MKSTFTQLVLIALVTIVSHGCVTTDLQDNVDVAKTPQTDRKYRDALDKATRDAKVIKDFETRYEVKATYLSPEFRQAFGNRMQDLFLKQDESLQETGTQAGFFVSVFAPEDAKMRLEDPDYWTVLLGNGGAAKPPVLVKHLADKLKWEPFFDYVTPWSREFLIVFESPAVAQGSPDLVEKTAMQVTFANADGKVKLGW